MKRILCLLRIAIVTPGPGRDCAPRTQRRCGMVDGRRVRRLRPPFNRRRPMPAALLDLCASRDKHTVRKPDVPGVADFSRAVPETFAMGDSRMADGHADDRG
jgi:hypothetical protein